MCAADPTTPACFRFFFLLSEKLLNIWLLCDRRGIRWSEGCHFPLVFDKLLLHNNNKFSTVTFFKKSAMCLGPAVFLPYQIIEGLLLPRAVFKLKLHAGILSPESNIQPPFTGNELERGRKGKTPQLYFFPPILFLAHHSSWVYEVFITKFHDFRKWNRIVGCHKRKKLTPYTWCLGRLTLHRTIYLRHFWEYTSPKRREMIKVHQMGPRTQALACSTADLTRNKP